MTARFSQRLASMTRTLVIPHGFTLSITGAFTLSVALRGFPHALAAYLFVVGATAGMGGLAVVTRARRREARPGGLCAPVLNVAPLVAAPAAAGAATLIPGEWPAFLVAGAVASAGYVVLLSLMSRDAEPEG